MKLDLGCGLYKKEGYTGVDPFVNTDIRRPMWDTGLPDDSVDEIWSDHAFEHLAQAEVIPTLEECRRIIKPTGSITIVVPDLVWCCQQFIAHQTPDWYLHILFGHQAHAGEFHKTGYTPRIMMTYADSASLTVETAETIQSHGQQSLKFVLRKI